MAEDAPVFRDPFTLRLNVDKQHFYEQQVRSIPYVYNGAIYLFAGEAFGITVEAKREQIIGISYNRNAEGSSIEVRFSQIIEEDGSGMMLLEMKNNTDKVILMDARMIMPGEDKVRPTTIAPLTPGMLHYETWPHPIIQLVLGRLRFQEAAGDEIDNG